MDNNQQNLYILINPFKKLTIQKFDYTTHNFVFNNFKFEPWPSKFWKYKKQDVLNTIKEINQRHHLVFTPFVYKTKRVSGKLFMDWQSLYDHTYPDYPFQSNYLAQILLEHNIRLQTNIGDDEKQNITVIS